MPARETNLSAMNAKLFKTLSVCLATLAGFVQPLVAQDTGTSTTTRHCLWKVQGTKAPVYLLGSFHLLKAEDWPLAAPLESAYTNARIAVFETDMAKMEEPETQMKVLAKSRLPAGETLKDQLSAETYGKFLECLKKMELPEEMFTQFKPVFAAVMLSVLEIQKLGFDPNRGVDKHFYERARKDGKEIVGLETLDFQIGLITEYSKEEGELLMKSSLKELENIRQSFGELVKAWKSGDAAKLEKLLNEALNETPVIAKRLLADRNRNWVPKIRELLRGDKPAVVIVGAGHLVGRESVVELLQKEGLKVTQL